MDIISGHCYVIVFSCMLSIVAVMLDVDHEKDTLGKRTPCWRLINIWTSV